MPATAHVQRAALFYPSSITTQGDMVHVYSSRHAHTCINTCIWWVKLSKLKHTPVLYVLLHAHVHVHICMYTTTCIPKCTFSTVRVHSPGVSVRALRGTGVVMMV